MSEKQYVTYGQSCGCGCGCGGTEASRAITGCRFSISPMCDDFINVILGAIGKVDTSKVWKMTDSLSTVYRGRQIHVEDAVKACFVHAYREGVHMTMEATFSKGCPGDTDADCLMAEDNVPVNEAAMKDIHFPVACKISLYPMGIPNYMEYIAAVVNHAIDLGIYEASSHYCTILRCDVQDLFSYIHYVNEYCGKNLSHYIFEVTLSVNSPTA
ncbi:MAG: Ykof family thiamine-binding protein [Clostridiales bacterium]|nr:Ykof family thiamine-binding protein [Clostridiales bacterium]